MKTPEQIAAEVMGCFEWNAAAIEGGCLVGQREEIASAIADVIRIDRNGRSTPVRKKGASRRRQYDDQVEAKALALYDRLNPKPDEKIAVSKAECIRMAEKQIARR